MWVRVRRKLGSNLGIHKAAQTKDARMRQQVLVSFYDQILTTLATCQAVPLK